MAFLPELYSKIQEENVEFSTSRETQSQNRGSLYVLYLYYLFHMMHDLGLVILSLFSVTVLHGVTQYQWHILIT